MRYINTKTAAAISGYSQRQIQYRVKEGVLPTKSMGGYPIQYRVKEGVLPTKSMGGYPKVWLYDLIAYMEFQQVFYDLNGEMQDRVRLIASE